MKRIATIALTAGLIFTSCSTEQQQVNTPASHYFKNDNISQRVDSVMSLMTLDEKISQLTIYPNKDVITGPVGKVNIDMDDYVKKGYMGGIFNLRTLSEVKHFQKIAVEESRLGIPLIFAMDMIHGYKTIYPINLGMSSAWDIDAMQRYARFSATEAASVGTNWTFSPMSDMSVDPRWGRVSECHGEDAFLAGQINAAMVKGYQGDNLADASTILACVKHFGGYGAVEAGREYNSAWIPNLQFHEKYLPPYKAAFDAGAATTMLSLNDINGEPATISKYLIDDLLYGELGFNGLIVSDYGSITSLVPHGVVKDYKEATLKSLEEGIHMDMADDAYHTYAKELVENGSISKQQIDKLCAKVLDMKFRLGLFDDPYRYCKADTSKTLYNKETMEDAQKMAEESMVLLQNNKDVLPVSKNKHIALIGPLGNDQRSMLSSWSMMGESKRAITFLTGLKDTYKNVTYAKGCNCDSILPGGIQAARRAAARADVLFIALGHHTRQTGESTSMTSLQLPECQKQLLREMKKTGKPIVLLLGIGRPINLTEEKDLADAMLVTWLPGTTAGKALANVVSGVYNPSGKLTMTFPRNVGQIPIYYGERTTGRPYGSKLRANQRMTSRYIDCPNTPLYPFGYGLSYTKFEYSNLKVLTPEVNLNNTVNVQVTLKNTGKVAGNEVAQLYVFDRVGQVTRPMRELRGFQKVYLKPGESRELTFQITPDDLNYYHLDMSFTQEAGEYDVWIGTDSNAALKSNFTVK